MTIYARIVDGQVVSTFDLTPDQYAALQANGKSAHLRLWIVDAVPAPSATQVVVIGPVVVGPVEAHQTYVLRDKTQHELDGELNAADYALLKQTVAELSTDIQAYNANPDMTGTQAVQAANLWGHVKDLQRQMRRNNRILRYFLRSLA